MISSPKFDGGIARLRARHGSTSYPDAFSKLIWQVVRHMNDAQFDFLVDSIIGEFKHEPPLSKIKEFAGIARHSIKNPGQDFKADIEYPPSIFDKEETDLFFKTLKEIIAGKKSKKQAREMIAYIEDRLTRSNIKFDSVLHHYEGDK